MANRLGIEINATENVTQKMKDVKQSFQDTASAASQLDKVKQRLDNISNSSMPAKRQLRELQVIMTNMNLDGLSNTDVFTEVAQRAGELKDAMADAQQAVRAYADDTFKIQAMGQAFEGVSAAMSIATSASALFGSSNEDVQKALLKVQSAMALVNGVQKISNLLNKDSALMLRIKQIRLAANTTSETALATATTAGTAAVVANTAATTVNTTAQRAWNVAKAVAKALIGDWTGLLLVGVTALGAYAIATSDSTDEIKQQTEATKEANNVTQDYGKVTQDTYANLMASYSKLKNQYRQLRTEHEKIQWIKDNANELDNLNLSINNVDSAEAAFNGNTDAVVQSFIARAKAAAKLAEMVDEYRKQMKLIDEMSDIESTIKNDAQRSGRTARSGDKINDASYHNSRYGYVNQQGNWVFHEQGAKLYSGTDVTSNPQYKAKQAELDKSIAKTDRLASEIAQDASQVKKINRNIKTTVNKPTKPAEDDKKDKKVATDGSIESMNKELRELQENLRFGLVPQDKIEETKQRISNLKTDIEKEEIKLGFKDDPQVAKQKAVQNTLNKLQEEFNNLEFKPKVSSFDIATGNIGTGDKLGDIEQQMNLNDQLIEKLNNLKSKYEELGDAGKDALAAVNDKLKEVNDSQANLGNQAQILENLREKYEKQKQALETIGNVAYSTSSMFSTLGNVFKQTGDDTAAAAMTILGSVADMVAQVVPQIMTLIAVKEGEAMASGTASAASMPFPANIAAIASIVATCIATFATIASVVAGSFANGGVVGGNSYYGDKLYAKVNSGETILNQDQAKRALDLMNDGGRVMQTVVGGEVKIKGSDLYVSLKNYSRGKQSLGKNIGIH